MYRFETQLRHHVKTALWFFSAHAKIVLEIGHKCLMSFPIHDSFNRPDTLDSLYCLAVLLNKQ